MHFYYYSKLAKINIYNKSKENPISNSNLHSGNYIALALVLLVVDLEFL
jgi:hypothetical protein